MNVNFSRKAAKLFWRLHNLPKPTAERPAPALLGSSPSLNQAQVAVSEVQAGAVSPRSGDELRPFCFWCALEAEQNGQPAERRGLRFIENCPRHRDNAAAAQSLFGLVA